MATPKNPNVIKLNITSGIKGQPLVLINRTTKEKLTTTLSANGQAVVDLENFASGVSTDDVIDVSVSGEVIGTTTITVSAIPQTITLSTSAILAGLSRGL